MFQFLTHPSTSQYLIGAVFIFTGIMHFVKPRIYIRIMPDYIPRHSALVYISGGAELLAGIGVLISRTQLWAAWGD